jgi:hypothetical protein
LEIPAVRRAQAQQYKTIPPRISAKAAKTLRGKVSQALRNPGDLAANRGAIDDYFKKYFFPTMTDTSPNGLGQLAKLRDDLFKRYLRSANSKPAQDYITGLTSTTMGLIALGPYHPAVRYNAVLILGELDQQYASKGANIKPPTPLPAGTNALLVLLEKDEFKGVKIPPMLKVGALVGLQRHARFGIDPQYEKRVTQGAIGLIQQQETPAEMSAEVHHWLKCLAGQVLVQQYSSGPDGTVNEALVSMIGDPEMSLEDRCCVAALLAEMDYSAAQGVDTATTVTALGNLAQAVTRAEADHARDFKEEMIRSGGQFQRGRINLNRQESGPRYERRRLLNRLLALTHGIEAVAKAADPETKGQLEALAGPMRPVITTAADKDSSDVNIANPIIELANEIDRVIGSWKSVDQPDEEKAEDEFS